MLEDYNEDILEGEFVDALTDRRMRQLKHTVIRASAGSGKTFQLSNRYLQLLVMGVEPDAILATTFTRKAAGEILGRVLQRLADGAKDEKGAADLSKDLTMGAKAEAKEKGEAEYAKVCEALKDIDGFGLQGYQRLLIDFCKQLHRVRISTIDSFFHKLGMSFKHELGLSDGSSIAQSGDLLVKGLTREAVSRLLEKHEPQTLIELMRRLHHDKATRSVTKALEDIVGDLHETYRMAEEKAMWRGVVAEDLLADETLILLMKKLDGLGELIGKDKRAKKAWLGDALQLRRKDWQGFVGNGIGKVVANGIENGVYTYYKKSLDASIVEVYEPLVRHAAGMLVKYAGQLTEATYELLHGYDELFRGLLEEQKVMLYSDVTDKLSKELPARLDGVMDEVYYRLDGQVSHLLLDEFQDTSPDQWRVIAPLASEIVAVNDGTKSFFCVGDTKQAIYGWRGGCAELFDEVEKELNMGAENRSNLNKSYRSSQVILDCVNDTFNRVGGCQLLQGHGKAGGEWEERFGEHEAAKEELSGYAALKVFPSVEARSHEMAVAIEIEKAVKIAGGIEVGVLVSTNKSIEPMIDALKAVGIEASGEGGHFITDDPAVQLMVSAMRLADHPGDRRSLFHVVNSPLGKILGIERASKKAGMICSRRIREALMRLGYAGTVSLWAKKLSGYCDERGAKRLTQLVNLAEEYETGAGQGWLLRAGKFADFIEGSKVEDATGSKVKVMTVHKSKGLEFDLVVLPELGKFIGKVKSSALVWRDEPTAAVSRVYRDVNEETRKLCSELEDVYQQEKERRLLDDLSVLYVAMTRAKHGLVMFADEKDFGKKAPRLCFGSLLREQLAGSGSLADELEEGTLYEHGDRDWAGKIGKDLGKVSEAKREQTYGVVFKQKTGLGRSLPRVSPSSMEGKGKVFAKDLMKVKRSVALDRGTVIHRLFEEVGFIEDGLELDRAGLIAIAGAEVKGEFEDREQWLEKQVDDFYVMLEKDVVRKTLSRPTQPAAEGQTVEVWREKNFTLRSEGKLLNGTFDRVVITRDREEITAVRLIDFKTDRVADDEVLEEKRKHYEPQIRAYCLALEKMLGVSQDLIKAELLFVVAGASVKI